MELRNLTNNPTDYLDAYCDAEVGHTNWAYKEFEDILEDIGNDVHEIIVIYKQPDEESYDNA